MSPSSIPTNAQVWPVDRMDSKRQAVEHAAAISTQDSQIVVYCPNQEVSIAIGDVQGW